MTVVAVITTFIQNNTWKSQLSKYRLFIWLWLDFDVMSFRSNMTANRTQQSSPANLTCPQTHFYFSTWSRLQNPDICQVLKITACFVHCSAVCCSCTARSGRSCSAARAAPRSARRRVPSSPPLARLSGNRVAVAVRFAHGRRASSAASTRRDAGAVWGVTRVRIQSYHCNSWYRD